MKKIALLLILITTSSMIAQNNQLSTVDVSGEGIINVTPDEVTINVRVENTGKNAAVLKQQNDRTVSEVLSFVKSVGIADKDVQTQYIRLSKNYEYNTKTYNYAANQSISIKLKDLNKYENLMNGLLQSGINRIDGISFSSSNKESLESDARKKAMANAQMKAKEYAAALNQSIGKAVSISEFQATNYPQPPMYRSAMAMEGDSAGGQQSIAPGEMEIRVTVNVRFLLN